MFAVVCPFVCRHGFHELLRHRFGEVGFVDDVIGVEHADRQGRRSSGREWNPQPVGLISTPVEDQPPAVKVALGVLGTLSIVCGIVATLLGAAAWFLSHQRTGTEGLAVIAAVFCQWVVALVGVYILGVPARRQGGKAARLGVFLNIVSVALTALALISYYA